MKLSAENQQQQEALEREQEIKTRPALRLIVNDDPSPANSPSPDVRASSKKKLVTFFILNLLAAGAASYFYGTSRQAGSPSSSSLTGGFSEGLSASVDSAGHARNSQYDILALARRIVRKKP